MTTPEVRKTDDDVGLDVHALARFMDNEQLPGDGIPELTRLTGGSQNELYLVARGDARSVLRTRGVGGGPERHKGLLRELTLLTALKGTDVPHAELLAGSPDDSVLGAPFYLMKEVNGWSPAGSWPSPYQENPSARGPLAFGLVEGAAKLARVDWKGRGLEGFGRPDGFHDRQVDRWLAFYKDYAFRDLPGMETATEWLRTHRPRHWEPGIMHGDYQFANVMFSNDVPTSLAAVIDWEMTTIGDPLLDLAWATLSWGPEGDDMKASRYLDLDGMPAIEDLLARYEEISGRSTEDYGYYLVLARWKLAIVLEKSYARIAAKGNVEGHPLASFGPMILELMHKAAEVAPTIDAQGVN